MDVNIKKKIETEGIRNVIFDALPNNVTNGEVLCMLFPNMQRVVTTIGVENSFDIDWWNASYKSKSEEKREMNNLEKAKEIVKAYYSAGDCGIFNSRNIGGDVMTTIYEGGGLTIDICYYWSYFEVFGLKDTEFKELKRYYDSLGQKERKNESICK